MCGTTGLGPCVISCVARSTLLPLDAHTWPAARGATLTRMCCSSWRRSQRITRPGCSPGGRAQSLLLLPLLPPPSSRCGMLPPGASAARKSSLLEKLQTHTHTHTGTYTLASVFLLYACTPVVHFRGADDKIDGNRRHS